MKKLGITLGILLIMAGTALFMNTPPGGMRGGLFPVRHGDGARQVARRLASGGQIRNETFFLALYVLYGRPGLYAGNFRIDPGMSSLRILRRITSYNATLIRVTIPEGYDMEQIARRLEERGVTSGDLFLALCTDRKFLKKRGIPAKSAEGYLFPDTYLFPPDASPETVFAVMHDQMKREASRAAASTDTGLSQHEILIMASLIEKEAKLPEERVIISSVYHNRLKRGMKLDCDPTVRYALKKYTRPLTFHDLKYDSPYNTYRRKGLPPTPICSPGKGAILAAVNPASTEYLFFVAQNDGSHYFSKNLKEHLKAVDRYRRGTN